MFEAEACWLRRALDRFSADRLSPLLDLGCGSTKRRKTPQPWIEDQLFRPLRTRNIDIVRVDMRPAPEVDVQADLTDPADLERLGALRPRALLCCNLLEHVPDPQRLAHHCLAMLAVGGLVFVTVPYSYPYHGDPIDTMFRPSLADLAVLFSGACLVDGTILGTGRSYFDDLRQRPALLFRHAARLPVPFLSFEKWRHSMAKLYRLNAEYRISCAVFERT
jgi:SAM-dependent methyltransferase